MSGRCDELMYATLSSLTTYEYAHLAILDAHDFDQHQGLRELLMACSAMVHKLEQVKVIYKAPQLLTDGQMA